MELSERLSALEAQVRELRDFEEVRHLLSTYAFNADVGRADEYLAGWTADGVYDLAEDMQLRGRQELGELLTAPGGIHKTRIENRSQHLVANLFIKVDGDGAWAEGYSVVLVSEDGAARIFAAGYNHWDFVRTDGRWLMTLRRRRVIGGPTWGGDVIKSYLA